jgi:glycosyltransferase involved in cell wall biosynthesis
MHGLNTASLRSVVIEYPADRFRRHIPRFPLEFPRTDHTLSHLRQDLKLPEIDQQQLMSNAGMRLVHVVDSLDRGGLERVVCDLSSEQLRRGYDVRVYCLLSRGSLAPELEARGVRVLCGSKRRGPDFRAVRELRRLLRGSARSVLHSHSMMPNYYACAARMLAGLSICIVNTRHDMGSTLPNDRRERLYRLSVPMTRLIVMVSERVKERFLADGIVPPRKARVVFNGIQTGDAQCATPADRSEARRLLGAEPGQFVVGCVGRLVELKNHVAVVRAVARLATAYPTLRLVLIGEGPLRDRLVALGSELGIADRLSLLGERPDVRRLLAGLDAFVMPSLTEGHSIALLEASAAGVPIIATKVGGNPEIVHHESTGLLVPADDGVSIVAALTRLLCDPRLAARLGANARNWALNHVSVPAMADGYERIYAECLAPSERGN